MRYLLLACILLASPLAVADLRVFACEPEWAALVRELGRDRVQVTAATGALQDPHHIQARPSLIARLRKADLLVCTGADLEIGWLPVLLRRAANPRVQPGQAGHFMATDYVTLLDVPESVDRALGDVHPQGNPHIQTDPHNMLPVARALGARLAELDAGHAADYRQWTEDFLHRWQQALAGWDQRARTLKGLRVVTQHKGWVYLGHWIDWQVVARLEPRPGVPPSAAHLAQVLQTVREHPVDGIVRAAYQPARPAEWLHQRTGLPVVVLPFTVGGSKEARDLFSLYDDTLSRLETLRHD
ncbi:MAG: zinc ABC transporter substrate-binding protein [Gammaproteobacteria bacterium]|nr:MAG: zinc ABC transporter substrate-binding protein [Gammaproteobacteria bacterium]